MPRSRSGSFYCPIEPSWAPLSLSQKAAISTVQPSSPIPPARRHVRTPSGDYQHVLSPISHRAAAEPKSAQSPRFLSTPELSSKYGFGANAAPSFSVAASASARKRHAYSPARPSPLSGEVVGPRPRCPSAMWASQTHHHPQRSRSHPTSSISSLHRSTLKAAFMSGPMARKARMYGIRVAWCVFGDARFEMAKDIFGRGSVSAGILGAPAQTEAEIQYEETVEMPMHDLAFDWEVVTSRSPSQPSLPASGSQPSGYSYLEIDQVESDSDEDSASSEESDYGSDETESDELDDEDEIHRNVLAAFEQTTLDVPLVSKHAYVPDDARWETLAFE